MAIENGIDAVTFWDMSYAEIMAAIEGYQRRMKSDYQMQAIIAFRSSDLLATLVGRMLGSNARVPNLSETYPGLFPELEQLNKQQQLKQQNWQLMKARVEQYAAEKRKRGEQKNGNDDRRTAGADHSGD